MIVDFTQAAAIHESAIDAVRYNGVRADASLACNLSSARLNDRALNRDRQVAGHA